MTPPPAECPTATIRRLTVRAVRLPMPAPHRTASGEIVESPLVLLDLERTDGVIGRAFVFTYTVVALVPLALFVRNLEPLLVGQSAAPLDVDRLLAARFRLLGPQGLAGMAAALVDMALWDAAARAAGLSLVRALGGTARRIPIYGGIGHDGAERSAAQAAAWIARGVRGVKPKIGYSTLAEDLRVVREIRAAIGPDAELMVDFNQCLDRAEAKRRVRALDDEGLAWIEEPLTAHDFGGMAELGRAARTPLQAGENWWGPLDFSHAVAAGATAHWMPDVMKVGGVTGWMRVAALAHAHGLPVSNHLFPEISAQLLCATPTAFRLEYADWWNGVLQQPLAIVDGHAVIDDTVAGSGIAWNEEVVPRHLVE